MGWAHGKIHRSGLYPTFDVPTNWWSPYVGLNYWYTRNIWILVRSAVVIIYKLITHFLTHRVLKIPFSFRFFTLEKEAACSALNTSLAFGNAHLLTCDVECCDGDNCNHPNFTGKYPMTWVRRLTSDAYGNVRLYAIYVYWITELISTKISGSWLSLAGYGQLAGE